MKVRGEKIIPSKRWKIKMRLIALSEGRGSNGGETQSGLGGGFWVFSHGILVIESVSVRYGIWDWDGPFFWYRTFLRRGSQSYGSLVLYFRFTSQLSRPKLYITIPGRMNATLCLLIIYSIESILRIEITIGESYVTSGLHNQTRNF